MEFQNQTVIITGASVGIGRAAALEFSRLGANLCLMDLDGKGLDAVADQAKALGAAVSTYVCDVSEEDSVRKVIGDAVEKHGQIHVLLNNAGLWRGNKPFVETDSEDWKRRIGVNILGLMYCTHATLPNMLEHSYGRIINIGSVAGTYGNRNMAAYSMTKGAVSSFTKALAKEVADKGITVNNVVPGTVRNEGKESFMDLCYMNRRGELDEFAHLICFLAGDHAAYISGQDYQIDGCRKRI